MRFFLCSLLILHISCQQNSTKKLTAQEIINKSIITSGSDKIRNAIVSFDFRDKHYFAERRNGSYLLKRYFSRNNFLFEDVLANDGFKRFINKKQVEISDSLNTKYSNALNSVHYFSVLPYGLNDKAVHKKLLTETTIKGKKYYKIQISFDQEGGGVDFNDVFIYWINQQTFLIDYLAYSFHVNGGGFRFRELKEQCIKEGIRFVDYNNFKAINPKTKLNDLDKAYENKQLKKVSEIILKNIEVTIL